jgi:hypothetical protein
LEEATGANLDLDFLTWVFPRSFEPVLADRRETKERSAAMRLRLADEGLPEEGLVAIHRAAREWDFASALSLLDALEANIDTYIELMEQANDLESFANGAGLTLPPDITDSLNQFDFEAARTLLASGQAALDSYQDAVARVDADRGLWERFGLLGSDPDSQIEAAEDAFAAGNFTQSREHSLRAEELMDDASSVAQRRMLVVAGFFGILALVIGLAIGVGQWRRRATADL